MKKILFILLGLVFILIGWYLLIKPYEYSVNFRAKTTQGDLIETIRLWNRTLDNCSIIEVDSLNSLIQIVKITDAEYRYSWNLKKVNDSVTQVRVEISEPLKSISNKLLIAFLDLPIERDANILTKQFYAILKEHLEITSVQIIGEVELEPIFCACRTVETDQINKANGMMANYNYLTEFTGNQNLQVNGPPLVRLLEWSHVKGTVKFDFCFPIVNQDSLQPNENIIFKQFDGSKAIKAVYYGNYITSDRAWYSLLNYATANSLNVKALPLEYFYNNPSLGVNEKEWKAEIYLPIH